MESTIRRICPWCTKELGVENIDEINDACGFCGDILPPRVVDDIFERKSSASLSELPDVHEVDIDGLISDAAEREKRAKVAKSLVPKMEKESISDSTPDLVGGGGTLARLTRDGMGWVAHVWYERGNIVTFDTPHYREESLITNHYVAIEPNQEAPVGGHCWMHINGDDFEDILSEREKVLGENPGNSLAGLLECEVCSVEATSMQITESEGKCSSDDCSGRVFINSDDVRLTYVEGRLSSTHVAIDQIIAEAEKRRQDSDDGTVVDDSILPPMNPEEMSGVVRRLLLSTSNEIQQILGQLLPLERRISYLLSISGSSSDDELISPTEIELFSSTLNIGNSTRDDVKLARRSAKLIEGFFLRVVTSPCCVGTRVTGYLRPPAYKPGELIDSSSIVTGTDENWLHYCGEFRFTPIAFNGRLLIRNEHPELELNVDGSNLKPGQSVIVFDGSKIQTHDVALRFESTEQSLYLRERNTDSMMKVESRDIIGLNPYNKGVHPLLTDVQTNILLRLREASSKFLLSMGDDERSSLIECLNGMSYISRKQVAVTPYRVSLDIDPPGVQEQRKVTIAENENPPEGGLFHMKDEGDGVQYVDRRHVAGEEDDRGLRRDGGEVELVSSSSSLCDEELLQLLWE
jgi:hypothetical protein